MYLGYREDYFRRKAMVNSQVEIGKIEDFNEGMQWDTAHDHKEACTCLPERYNPYE